MTSKKEPAQHGPFRVIDKLNERERTLGPDGRTGLVMVRFLIEALKRSESEVVGVGLGLGSARRTFDRWPGESVDQLERRANPGSSHQTFPMPVFRDDTHAMSDAEWDGAVHRAGAVDAKPHAIPPRNLH